jgi:hypothetical protein
MAWITRGSDVGNVANTTSPNYVKTTCNFTASGPWEDVASHEVFTVTGLVRVRIWIECTSTLTDVADGATIQFGYEGSTNAWIAATNCARAGAGLLSTGCLWYDTSPLTTPDITSTVIFDKIVNELDIGFEVAGAALTGGVLDFHCVWEPMNDTGNVVSGAGGSL